MKLSQVAVQLFTLREHLKTPADIAISLEKVRAIGYEAIQVSSMGPIPEDELVGICRNEGLTIIGTHEPGAKILSEPAAVAERLHKLGCNLTAYPYSPGLDFGNASAVAELIEKLGAAGEVLAQNGCSLSYHNHANEFLRAGSRTILEQIYEETDPRHLQAELDTYWIQYGGGDPVAWCRKMAGRLPWLHCKDYQFTAENKPAFGEIGSGNLDWPAILSAAEASGCQWFIVEQDICPGDPFESLRKSFDYMKENLCQ